MHTETPFEVYLVDPGVHASQVITLVQEVTHRDTAECAAMVHETPARIAAFASRQTAEDLVARFREFDALAIVRRPGEKGLQPPPPPTVVPQPRVPVAIGLIALGVILVGQSLWWLLQTPGEAGPLVLLGVGGLILGALSVVAGIWKLRRDDLD